jgi:hypothetical protein
MDKVNQILRKVGGFVHDYIVSEDNRIIGIIMLAVIGLLIILAIV